MEEYSEWEFDVIVIGAGGAGLRAAIEASSSGAKVGMITKSMLGKAHTVMAEGGAAAALANKDMPVVADLGGVAYLPSIGFRTFIMIAKA